MRLVELDSHEDFWEELTAGEEQPFGEIATALSWREKPLRFGLRDKHGRLLAAAGLVVADVIAGAGEPFEVTGLGGVIVTRAARGRGLGRAIIEHALARAGALEPERAMLFCLKANVALYRKFGFAEIGEPVSAEQPRGDVEVPMPAMWKPLREGALWPQGPVRVIGEPF